MDEEERYLGGFFSLLQLALSAFAIGVGVYATTKRLFVVGPLYMGKQLRGSVPHLDKVVAGADSKLFASSNLSREQNADIINEILQHNGTQIEKSSISRLEIKKPPGIFRTGSLNIVQISGSSLRVKIGKKSDYEGLVRLLEAFDADSLKIL